MVEPALELRGFRPADLDDVLDLWRAAYGALIGYVPRSEEYWRWCILDRPGVEASDIVIARHGPNLSGYGVLGPAGDVLELAVDPAPPRRRRLKVARALIEALEARSRDRGDEFMRIRLPNGDRAVTRAMLDAGYLQSPFGALQWVIEDVARFTSDMLAHCSRPTGPTSILLSLEPGRYHFASVRRLGVVLAPRVEVTVDPPNEGHDVVIQTDYSTLTDLVFGRIGFDEAAAAGLVQVIPDSALQAASRFIDLISFTQPWYTPLADAR